jgi:hypothetical protein
MYSNGREDAQNPIQRLRVSHDENGVSSPTNLFAENKSSINSCRDPEIMNIVIHF